MRVGIKENNWGTHPALHYWSIQARVATGSAQYARWKARPCSDTNPQPVPEGDIGSSGSSLCIQAFDAEVVVSEPAGELHDLWTFPEGGVKCLVDKLEAGEELLPSGVSCSTRGSVLYLQSH